MSDGEIETDGGAEEEEGYQEGSAEVEGAKGAEGAEGFSTCSLWMSLALKVLQSLSPSALNLSIPSPSSPSAHALSPLSPLSPAVGLSLEGRSPRGAGVRWPRSLVCGLLHKFAVLVGAEGRGLRAGG